MARKTSQSSPGRVIYVTHTSSVLRDNPLGDPYERSFPVYLPAAYDRARGARRFPVLFDLVGFTGAGPGHVAWRAFEENVPEMLDRLIATKKMPPCIVVFPDCFTAMGGNQYINSSALGRYADYVNKELIALIDGEFRTHASREKRGVFGKSSGGYGAMMYGMKYPQNWGAIANHSGDAYFGFVYQSEWPAVLTSLQRYKPARKPSVRSGHDDGRIRAFLEAVWANPRPSGDEVMALMMLAMAASYDPAPSAANGFRVPYDLDSGQLLANRWQAWRKHDPVNLIGSHKAALKSLRGLYIDCGSRDQFHIHYGSRQLASLLKKHRIKHRYEEFDGTHSGIDHRMNVSLPFLAKAIA